MAERKEVGRKEAGREKRHDHVARFEDYSVCHYLQNKIRSTVKNLLYGDSSNCTSQAVEHNELTAQILSAFLSSKVLDIQKAISTALGHQTLTPLSADKPYKGEPLSSFAPVSSEEARRILSTMPTKSSPCRLHSNTTTQIMQLCLCRYHCTSFQFYIQSRSISGQIQKGQITPILKRQGMAASDPANFRPISNLNPISKII
jgi:hypothetical protein